jgi:hypothetical protein
MTFVLQHPRILELKGLCKPNLVFFTLDSSESRAMKRPYQRDFADRCNLKRSKFAAESEAPSDSRVSDTADAEDEGPTLDDTVMQAILQDRANLISENQLLKKRIAELTAQVLALQMSMSGPPGLSHCPT